MLSGCWSLLLYYGVDSRCACVLSGYMLIFVFFFFKQKTAYEMRISDWSSDVCSSDLGGRRISGEPGEEHPDAARREARGGGGDGAMAGLGRGGLCDRRVVHDRRRALAAAGTGRMKRTGINFAVEALEPVTLHGPPLLAERDLMRSEEHTSELQSLMRTSYADFC